MTLAISGRLFLQYFDFSFRYHVVRISEEFPRNFTWLYELYNSKTYGGRMLIFFPTIYHLGDTYQYVTANITESAPSVYMFHKKTSDSRKAEILRLLSQPQSDAKLTVVMCTSSFSLGLDLKDISYVIHYGPPRKTEDYLQETGRAARERGSHGHAILLTFSGDRRGRMLDDNMKEMVTQERCRREILTVKFNIREEKPQDCCDHCQWDITLPGSIIDWIHRYNDVVVANNEETSQVPSSSTSSSSESGREFGELSP